ncbi:NB-ARC domains-containing protein [Tanacetum coccineum]
MLGLLLDLRRCEASHHKAVGVIEAVNLELFETLVEEYDQFFMLMGGLDSLISIHRKNMIKPKHTSWQKLKMWSLSLIQAFLEDASQKEVKSKAFKQWLNDLHHLAYDIDDILDDLAMDAMHNELINESEGFSRKVRKLMPTFFTSFSLSTSVGSKLDDISTRLQELMEEKEKLGLSVKDGGQKIKIAVTRPLS